MGNENDENKGQDFEDLGVDTLLTDAGVDVSTQDDAQDAQDKGDDDSAAASKDTSKTHKKQDDDTLDSDDDSGDDGDSVPDTLNLGDDSFSLYPDMKDEITEDGKPIKKEKDDEGDDDTSQDTDDTAPSDEDEKSRDYKIFENLYPDVDPKVFRGTRNSVFNTLKDKIIPEIKTLRTKAQDAEDKLKKINAGQMPDTFYSHPQAYTLTPEYQVASTEVSVANFEESVHRKALADLRAKKEKVRVLDGYDTQNNPTYKDVEVKEDADREQMIADLMQTLSSVAAHRQQYTNMAQQVAARHANRNKQLHDMVKELEQKRLARYIPDDNPRAKEIKGFIEALPPELRSERLAGPASKMYGYLIDLSIQLKQAKQQLAAKKAAVSDQRSAEPGASGRAGKAKHVSDLKFTWDDDIDDFELK